MRKRRNNLDDILRRLSDDNNSKRSSNNEGKRGHRPPKADARRSKRVDEARAKSLLDFISPGRSSENKPTGRRPGSLRSEEPTSARKPRLDEAHGGSRHIRDEIPKMESTASTPSEDTTAEQNREAVALHGGDGGNIRVVRVEEPMAPEGDGVDRWVLAEVDNIRDSVEGYLIDVRYDGSIGKAVAFIYVPEEGRIYRWIDQTGHKPYFLVEGLPEDLRKKGLDFEKHKAFVRYEVVSKFHPIERRKVRVTKVVVNDPLSVRGLRQRAANKNVKYWEADIRYHHNYIFDNLLVPGMPYRVSKTWRPANWKSTPELVEAAFSDEPEETRETARTWSPFFEHPPPSMPRLAVDIEVYTPEEGKLPDPESAPYPVISIGLADNRGMVKVLLLGSVDTVFEEPPPDDVEVEIFDDERSLLLEAMRIMEQYPVVVTFNGDNFDLPYMYNRLVNLGIDPGKLPFEFHQDYVTFKHSLHIDLYKFFDIKALQVYAFGGKYREKNLDAIAQALLGEAKEELEDLVSKISLDKLVKYNSTDARLTIKLTTFSNDLVWNLIILLMRISKLGLEDVTRTQVSGWIKGLVNWEHRRRGWLIPSKEEIAKIGGTTRSSAIISDKKYKGAIVLDPPQGIFFDVVVVDFASLYPSIIKNWNLSYETVNNPHCQDTGEVRVVPEVEHKVCMGIKGISSEIVGLLRDLRVKIYKRKAKQKDLPQEERLWYDTVQAAMKVYINASYGVFGNENFHLYSPAVAESVTAVGRSVLSDTLRRAQALDLVILYGDTDSLFVWDPPGDRLDKVIQYVKEEHNLDLEIDKKFRITLFSGLKKNYIGISDDGKIVIKGMVGKKSNTPEFIKGEFARAVEILTELRDPEDITRVLEKLRDHVISITRKLRNKEYTLDELAIRIMMSKNPDEYKKNTPQHVKAARLLEKYGIDVGKGSVIAFVKTRDSLGVRPVKLAKLAEVDAGKYNEYVRTAFEQMLLAFGVHWKTLAGGKTLIGLIEKQ